MAAEPFDAVAGAGQAAKVADALDRLGTWWWVLFLVGSVGYSDAGRTPWPFLVIHRLFDLAVIVALVRLRSVVPRPVARRLGSVVALALASTALLAVVEAVWRSPGTGSVVHLGLAAVSLAAYVLAMCGYAESEDLLGAVVPSWRRARAWSLAVVAFAASAGLVWSAALFRAAGSSASHATRDVAAGFAVATMAAWVGALLNTAQASSATREVFDHEASILHGPIVRPSSPS